MTREEAIQTLNAMFCQYSHIRKSDSEWDAINMAIEALQKRPKGRWGHLGGDEWCCSNCGYVIFTEGSWEDPTAKFCENCGADMRESE